MVDKIRAEIERLRKGMIDEGKQPGHDSELIRLTTINTCQNILCAIESLKDETSEDLEKEIERFIEEQPVFSGQKIAPSVEDTARHFAAWQKKQILKDAIDFDPDELGPVKYIRLLDKGYEQGDKIKLIIVKE